MQKASQFAIMIAAAAGLAACASKPEAPPPEPVAPPPPPVVTAPPVPSGPAAGSLADFRASVGQERVFFDLDRFDLDMEDRATLDAQAAWLSRYPNVAVRIAGHADERGTREYNLALGARRAQSVKDYLVSRGISADRIETVSFGKEQPLDPRSSEEAWSLNRRAETQLPGLSS